MTLVSRNIGDQAFTLTEALHSYFDVQDISHTTVQGLDGCSYLDKVQNFASATQTGLVTFTTETDRVYVNTTSECVINDAPRQRQIHVTKQGSASTVVWNPWSEREKAIADMAAGEYRHMLCVETCNAGPDQITLPPGGTHTLMAQISVT
ncbi:MAG: putative Aldose 1-epimerase [Comamonadaceae bacterium]|nr:MAG: putative Aldose 1-epimerase [Comamonadaceae bacterium]